MRGGPIRGSLFSFAERWLPLLLAVAGVVAGYFQVVVDINSRLAAIEQRDQEQDRLIKSVEEQRLRDRAEAKADMQEIKAGVQMLVQHELERKD